MGDWMSEQKRNEVGLINMPRRDEKAENLQKHLEWPFYKDAETYRESIRKDQIVKGSEKYPEPFTTKSWSNQEIVDHAMQENVDQGHYIFATGERMKALSDENEYLKKHVAGLEAHTKAQFNTLAESVKTNFDRTAEIKELQDKLELAQKETEYWRLRTLQNNNWSVPGIEKNPKNSIYNGGCV